MSLKLSKLTSEWCVFLSFHNFSRSDCAGDDLASAEGCHHQAHFESVLCAVLSSTIEAVGACLLSTCSWHSAYASLHDAGSHPSGGAGASKATPTKQPSSPEAYVATILPLLHDEHEAEKLQVQHRLATIHAHAPPSWVPLLSSPGCLELGAYVWLVSAGSYETPEGC